MTFCTFVEVPDPNHLVCLQKFTMNKYEGKTCISQQSICCFKIAKGVHIVKEAASCFVSICSNSTSNSNALNARCDAQSFPMCPKDKQVQHLSSNWHFQKGIPFVVLCNGPISYALKNHLCDFCCLFFSS